MSGVRQTVAEAERIFFPWEGGVFSVERKRLGLTPQVTPRVWEDDPVRAPAESCVGRTLAQPPSVGTCGHLQQGPARGLSTPTTFATAGILATQST